MSVLSISRRPRERENSEPSNPVVLESRPEKHKDSTSSASIVSLHNIGGDVSPNNGLIFRLLRAECDLTANQKLVLLVLLNHWNPNNAGSVVWPGQPRIAAHACLTCRGAQNVLYQLEQIELIKTTHETGKSNRYILNIDAIESITHEPISSLPTKNIQEPTKSVRDPHEPISSECLNERLNNPLRHSAKPKQREIPMLGDILRNALQKKVQ